MPRSSRRNNRAVSQARELEELASQSEVQMTSHTSDPLENIIERLTNVNQTKPKFKAPKYNGESDVELFINQFIDIAEANKWSERETALHLRSNLEGAAATCSQSSELDEILLDLRARFGITPKQARTKLNTLQKKTKETFHELGAEVTRLVKIAYPRQDRRFWRETSLEIFSRALNHKALQQHLLARPHDTIAEAVQICNEFTQIEGNRTFVTNIDIDQPSNNSTTSEMKTLLTTIQEVIKKQGQLLERISKAQNNNTQPKRKIECYICGGPHIKLTGSTRPGHHKTAPRTRSKNTSQAVRSDNIPVKYKPQEIDVNTVHGQCLYVPGKIEGQNIKYLLDTGASDSILAKATLNRLPKRIKERLVTEEMTAALADGSGLLLYGHIELSCRIRSLPITIRFLVANIAEDAILGMKFFMENNCQLLIDQGVLSIHGKNLSCIDKTGLPVSSKIQITQTMEIPAESEIQIPCKTIISLNSDLGLIENLIDNDLGIRLATGICNTNNRDKISVQCINPHPTPILLKNGTTIGTFTSIQENQIYGPSESEHSIPTVTCNQILEDEGGIQIPQHLQLLYNQAIPNCTNYQQEKQLANLLVQYADVFSSDDTDVGRTDLVTHSIPTLPGAQPIKQAPRRLGVEKEQEVERQVEELAKKGMIEPADSAWSSPVVLVKKKDGKWRLCIDYRRLNAVTKRDAYPLPRIDDSLDSLSGSMYFSTLDLLSGYWQVPLDADAQEKSAFATRSGLWKWKVLSFGLTSAPATFERLMEKVLHGLQWKSLLLYLDDVIVFSPNFASHLERLQEVLQRFRTAKLKLKPSKCALLQEEVKYLGHMVSNKGVSTDPDKIKAVTEWKEPTCQNELRTFLGFTGYYRRFCPDYASIAKPLYKLTTKGVPFVWGEEERKIFLKMKNFLIKAPTLAYPDNKLQFILDTDASLDGMGAVLSQIQDGEEKPIAYYSKTLSPPERNYCVTRRELLAVVMAVKYFRPYLYGKQFLLRTDHSSLQWLYRRKEPSHQVARWLEILSEFSFTLQHRAGSKHLNADGLSRSCVACKQCDNIVKRDGGPSWSELIAHTETNDSDINIINQDYVQRIQITDKIKEELPTLQQTKNSDLGKLYKAIQENNQIPNQEIELGSWELKKLAEIIHLCRIKEGVLQLRQINKSREKWLNICPKNIRPTIIQSTHTQHHTGVNRTYQRIKNSWYWPGMHGDIKRAIKTCEICQSAKKTKNTVSQNRQRLFAGRPWQTVSIDLVGPLSVTPRNNRMILVISDHFTRWRDAIPIPNGTTEVIARALDERIFSIFGLPERIHSDQGAQFESKLFQELCTLWQIHKSRTTSYHPQGNGVVERGNREIGDALRALLLRRDESDWDLLLPSIMRSIRATPHSFTGETPNFLMFGREITTPDTTNHSQLPEISSREQYTNKLIERMENAQELVREIQHNIVKEDTKSPPIFKINDFVWLESRRIKKGTTAKLQPKYLGPFKIIEAYTNNTYLIEQDGKLSTENECRLKLYSPSTSQWGRAPTSKEPQRQPPCMGRNLGTAHNKNKSTEIPSEITYNQNKSLPASMEELVIDSDRKLETDHVNTEATPLDTSSSTPSEETNQNTETRRKTRVPIRFQDFCLYTVKLDTRVYKQRALSPNTSSSAAMDEDILEVHIKETDKLSHTSSSSNDSDSSDSSDSSDNSDSSDLPTMAPQEQAEKNIPARTHSASTQDKTNTHRPVHNKERTNIRRVERKDQRCFNKVYPDSNASKDYPYIHKETLKTWEDDVRFAKNHKICQRCECNMDKTTDLIRRHAWDHLACYVCECGHYSSRYEAMHSHQMRRHSSYRMVRIDKFFFNKAKLEINANFPEEFPVKEKENFLKTTTSSRTSTTRRNTPPKRPISPIAIPSPRKSPRNNFYKRTMTSTPLKKTPTKVYSPVSRTSPPDFDVNHIIAKMTEPATCKKKLSPIKTPRKLTPVTTSSAPTIQKRSVRFALSNTIPNQTIPVQFKKHSSRHYNSNNDCFTYRPTTKRPLMPAKNYQNCNTTISKKPRLVVPAINNQDDILDQIAELRKLYKRINELHSVIMDTRNHAEVYLTNIEDAVRKQGEENVEN